MILLIGWMCLTITSCNQFANDTYIDAGASGYFSLVPIEMGTPAPYDGVLIGDGLFADMLMYIEELQAELDYCLGNSTQNQIIPIGGCSG